VPSEKVKTLKQIIEFEIHLMLNLETSENECVDNIMDKIGKLVTRLKEPCTEHWKHEERVNSELSEDAELEYIIPNRIDCPECQSCLSE
jgi:hypothetical protein